MSSTRDTGPRDAGIVDQDVESTACPFTGLHQPDHIRLHGHVAHHAEAAHLQGDPLNGLRSTTEEDRFGPVLDEPAGDRRPDVPTAARDQGDLVLQDSAHSPNLLREGRTGTTADRPGAVTNLQVAPVSRDLRLFLGWGPTKIASTIHDHEFGQEQGNFREHGK